MWCNFFRRKGISVRLNGEPLEEVKINLLVRIPSCALTAQRLFAPGRGKVFQVFRDEDVS